MVDSVPIVTSFQPPRRYSSRSLAAVSKDFHLFTLAPLYILLDVPFDIVQQFRAEIEDTQHVQVATEYPVINSASYSNFLEGIAKSAVMAFTDYMRNLTFVDKRRSLYSEVIWELVPEAVLANKLDPLPELQGYRVYLPDSNKARYILDRRSRPLGVISTQPDASVLSRGSKLLS